MTFTKIKCKMQHLLPHHLLSRLIAKLAESKTTAIKNQLIKIFIKVYKVDLTLAVGKKLEDYASFNEFFTRALLPDVRPVVSLENELASPADGRLFQAKDHDYNLGDLLGGRQIEGNLFEGGSFITIYLAPKDYHRVHMPIAGKLIETIYVPGKLFSVNHLSVTHLPNLFCRNERLICLFETKIGKVAVILIGAMLVAGIETVWGQNETPCLEKEVVIKDYRMQDIYLNKGDEMGRFKFGSTVIVLWPATKVALKAYQPLENIKMGSLIGYIS
jgi:phosphatidylserine decarboxylase